MNSPIRVAQAAGIVAGGNAFPSTVKVSKPQTGQAVTIHFDGPVKIDLTH